MSIGSRRAEDGAEWVRWRGRRLVSAGFQVDEAQRLARSDRIDLHRLLELVDRGCPPDLAARILAPLDDPTGDQKR
ncbi:MAG: hypothetical protein JO286_10760 [Solirubrobacterales bacterium]|nr:hypothetical protein [Solirubrobacterales bacterium]MBV9365422.1 hypothetical protein [Solirubrobacterales bacterium]MBV9807655.1 hypothetical protein [Solirubrobacterales bacterium]